MLAEKSVLLLGCLCLGALRVSCIVSKGASDAAEEKKEDSVAAQSIDRDYGYDDGYAHGGYGLSAHASYGLPGGHEGYGVHEDKHVHHLEDHHHHHHHGHHKHDYGYHKALAIKGLLVPLAGVALLGAAAAFVSNPILLQLGVISGSSLGRRRRSADPATATVSPEDRIRLNEIKLLERFVAQVPREEIRRQEKKMIAGYLACSGPASRSLCLERLACELHSREGRAMPTEASVLGVVLGDVLANDFVPRETRDRLAEAVDRGKRNAGCLAYECAELEELPVPGRVAA